MAKLYVQQKKLNPADELREILTRLEEQLLTIKKMNSTEALMFMRDLDQVYTLFGELEGRGLKLAPEQGRFEVVQKRLEKRASPLLSALGGAVALRETRPSPPPARERWWWYIHELVALERQRLLKRLTITAIVILSIISGVALLFKTVLAPSPETLARVDAENAASTALDAGDYEAALAAVEEGLAVVPGDPGLLIFAGVLQEMLGRQAAAAENFAQARTILDDPLLFYLTRSQLEVRANQLEKAEQSAQAALDVDEESARAWLILAQALELQDRTFEAVPAYERAGQLAMDEGNNEIVVLSRLALSRLGASPRGLN